MKESRRRAAGGNDTRAFYGVAALMMSCLSTKNKVGSSGRKCRLPGSRSAGLCSQR